jgi:dihydrofolate reductase
VRKLKLIEHMSLDGVIQVTGDDPGFPYGDWTAPWRTEAGREAVLESYGTDFDLLIGRDTYDAWSGYWPAAPRSPMSDRLNAAMKFVVTHRDDPLPWAPATRLGPDLVDAVAKLKSNGDRDLVLSGSISLVAPVLEHGLVDEVILIVYPVLLGAGRRLFPEGSPARTLQLVTSKAMTSGVILTSYRVGAPLKAG